MSSKVFIVLDLNGGTPLYVFKTLQAALQFQYEAEEQYPETEIVEVVFV